MPGCKFASLLAFAAAVGAEGINHSYAHRSYFLAALYAMSDVLLNRQITAINQSPFFTLMCDTSTDVAMHDHLLVHVQYIDPMTLLTCVEYLCTVQVIACTADATVAVLEKVLEVLGLDINKMVGFCSDGAATFTGRLNGVAVP
jgi:hypothetical protein